MICLGIESTAHTFGVGVVDEKCRVLANEKDSHSTEAGGLIPRELTDHHVMAAPKVIEKALQSASVKMKDIEVVAFSIGPGIGPALKVGAVAARTLSLKYGKPLLGVNHPIAHIEIGKTVTGCNDPLVVYASGGNTQIIGFDSGKYRVYGETLDTGIGNLLDSFGRELGLGFPAGPKIDAMYFKANKFIELPYSVKGMDLHFSGLLTAAKQNIGKCSEKNLAYSLMHTAFAMVTEVTERALAHCDKDEVLLIGGVAANQRLCEMLKIMCRERKAKFYAVPVKYSGDNAAMIGWQGILEYKKRKTEEDIDIRSTWRIDQVETVWI